MIDGANNLTSIAQTAGGGVSPLKTGGAQGTGSSGFSDVLRKSIDEVTRLQQDASKAVEDLMTGKTEDVAGVMTAMEKSDLAFKTLLTIRAKLMEAYEEVKSMQV